VTSLTAATAASELQARFGATPTMAGGAGMAGGDVGVTVEPGRWLEAARFVRDTLGCRYFNWLTAVDYKDQGMDVVVRLDNLEAVVSVTLRTRLAAGALRCASLTGLFRGANWMERECYDMFGVTFEGHPDLRRILLGDDWEGYPLRKDYAVDTPHAPYR